MGWVRAGGAFRPNDVPFTIYEAEGRMGALTVTASAGRLGPRLGDGDPLEDMGMFT